MYIIFLSISIHNVPIFTKYRAQVHPWYCINILNLNKLYIFLLKISIISYKINEIRDENKKWNSLNYDRNPAFRLTPDERTKWYDIFFIFLHCCVHVASSFYLIHWLKLKWNDNIYRSNMDGRESFFKLSLSISHKYSLNA